MPPQPNITRQNDQLKANARMATSGLLKIIHRTYFGKADGVRYAATVFGTTIMGQRHFARSWGIHLVGWKELVKLTPPMPSR